MAEKGFRRKFAAILNVDLKGYSRLMDDDEAATVRMLATYRNAMATQTMGWHWLSHRVNKMGCKMDFYNSPI